MVREIVKDEEFLTQKSILINYIEEKELIKDLEDTAQFYSEKCCGLASVQIGELKKIIIVKMGEVWTVMLNPVILHRSKEGYIAEEGCLSLEGMRKVKRNKSIEILYSTKNGKIQKRRFNDFIAEVIQHEVDHCNGILI